MTITTNNTYCIDTISEARPSSQIIMALWVQTLKATSIWMAGMISDLFVFHERSRQRHALAKLDDRLLDDIGVSAEAAKREFSKPFWQK